MRTIFFLLILVCGCATSEVEKKLPDLNAIQDKCKEKIGPPPKHPYPEGYKISWTVDNYKEVFHGTWDSTYELKNYPCWVTFSGLEIYYSWHRPSFDRYMNLWYIKDFKQKGVWIKSVDKMFLGKIKPLELCEESRKKKLEIQKYKEDVKWHKKLMEECLEENGFYKHPNFLKWALSD